MGAWCRQAAKCRHGTGYAPEGAWWSITQTMEHAQIRGIIRSRKPLRPAAVGALAGDGELR